MPTGTVKWFNNAKGYGFILGENCDGEDLFVHYSSINVDGYKTLKAGEVITYDVIQGPKGLHAVNIFVQKDQMASDEPDSSNADKTVSTGIPVTEP